MPVFDMTEETFLNHPDWDIFSFGRSPVAIDIMTAVKGLEFDLPYEKARLYDDQGLQVRTLHKNDLITAKKASYRPKVLDDLENLL